MLAMKLFIIAAIIISLCLPTLAHAKKRHYQSNERIQFSATDEQVRDLNRRLNTEGGRIPSLYFHDRTSPYDPVSVFNIDYCGKYPTDPNCYGNTIRFELGY